MIIRYEIIGALTIRHGMAGSIEHQSEVFASYPKYWSELELQSSFSWIVHGYKSLPALIQSKGRRLIG